MVNIDKPASGRCGRFKTTTQTIRTSFEIGRITVQPVLLFLKNKKKFGVQVKAKGQLLGAWCSGCFKVDKSPRKCARCCSAWGEEKFMRIFKTQVKKIRSVQAWWFGRVPTAANYFIMRDASQVATEGLKRKKLGSHLGSQALFPRGQRDW